MNPLTVDQAALDHLSVNFAGSLIRPDNPRYDEARKVFNGGIDRRPALIAQCEDVRDVVSAVELARANQATVAVRGGGHGVSGHAVCDDGMVIDLRRMNRVEVDPERRVARVMGGANWGQVDAATQQHGLAVTGGRMSDTGVGGLTLGGGSGWLERKLGFTADNLLAAEIVTADGRVLRATADENPELFWGLHGGSGNFGVVTAFEFQLHPVGPLILAGMIMHPRERAGELVRFYRDFLESAPDELGGAVALMTAPPEPFVPEAIQGQPVAGVIVTWADDPDEGEQALRPLLEWGPPAMTMVDRMPYTVVQTLINDGNPWGMQNYWKADFLPELPDEAVDVWIEHGNMAPSPMSTMLLMPGGGAISRVPDGATPLGIRDSKWNYHAIGMWEDPADSDANVAWARELADAMHPWAAAETYLNFIGDEGEERVRTAFGPAKYARLVALKDEYDPTNLFRLNQNVRPSAGALARAGGA
jgi:FAD/FMN-containing dehydrogenase